MAQIRRFLFDTDFSLPGGKPQREDPGAPGAAAAQAAAEAEASARAAAEASAFARGLQEGRAQAEAQVQARLADALNRVAAAAAGMIAAADERDAAREAQALDFAVALGRKIAGAALDSQPVAVIAEAAGRALQHLRGVPHLAIRVHDDLVEETERQVARLARERGYDGRLIVLGDPGLAPGDARIEWADGGVVRDRAAIEAAVLAALAPA
ncbi:flagellar assembly protein FliH [Methylobacterium indicum]|uniref:FliH/SctL family protein n=1 Tax=Methylobacterium indicum TaxID=1775910 RepID=UPI000734EEB4|nr:FliH/SctL family protein [Methylobacterium indicum]KTS24884.1 flagellar assembly protein FliH [Methylobacterium indicum]KTS26180.1 flagellar assembly protein FliH [Methylobacterium indicum]KTS51288.1 flagellar assembly protein FliH [Methylobacterium indicum]